MRSNQEYFDPITADIFARLYMQFPEPVALYTDGIFYNKSLIGQDVLDEDPERIRQLYAHALQWLADEGYLRFGQAHEEDGNTSFHDVVLSLKGLKALRKIPDTLSEPKKTLGDKIREATTAAATEAAKAKVKELVGQALGWVQEGLSN